MSDQWKRRRSLAVNSSQLLVRGDPAKVNSKHNDRGNQNRLPVLKKRCCRVEKCHPVSLNYFVSFARAKPGRAAKLQNCKDLQKNEMSGQLFAIFGSYWAARLHFPCLPMQIWDASMGLQNFHEFSQPHMVLLWWVNKRLDHLQLGSITSCCSGMEPAFLPSRGGTQTRNERAAEIEPNLQLDQVSAVLDSNLGRGLGRDEKASKGVGVRLKKEPPHTFPLFVNQHDGESTRSRYIREHT